MNDFFRRVLQLTALTSVVSVLFLNTFAVPRGRSVFLQSASTGWIDKPLTSGYHFLWSGFVPGLWKKYYLETGSKLQEIRLKLPLQYSEFLRLSDAYFVQVTIHLESEIAEPAAWEFLKSLDYKPEGREAFISERLRWTIEEFFSEIYKSDNDLAKLKAEFSAFFQSTARENFQSRLNRFTGSQKMIVVKNIDLTELKIPERNLYLSQTQNITEVMQAERKALLHQIEADSTLAIERKRNLEDLRKAEKISELIKENPQIIEYYKVEKLAGKAGTFILDTSSNHSRANSNTILGSEHVEKNKNQDESGGQSAPIKLR